MEPKLIEGMGVLAASVVLLVLVLLIPTCTGARDDSTTGPNPRLVEFVDTQLHISAYKQVTPLLDAHPTDFLSLYVMRGLPPLSDEFIAYFVSFPSVREFISTHYNDDAVLCRVERMFNQYLDNYYVLKIVTFRNDAFFTTNLIYLATLSTPSSDAYVVVFADKDSRVLCEVRT